MHVWYACTRFRLSKPYQRRRRNRPTSPLLLLQPSRYTAREDRHPRQSLVVRRIYRLESFEKRMSESIGMRIFFRKSHKTVLLITIYIIFPFVQVRANIYLYVLCLLMRYRIFDGHLKDICRQF